MKALWKWAWPHVSRGLTRGFAEFYKNKLLRQQFETDGHDPSELQIALNDASETSHV